MKQLRRKLHKRLNELESELKAHTKEYGDCYSTCETWNRLNGEITGITFAIKLSGGRISKMSEVK